MISMEAVNLTSHQMSLTTYHDGDSVYYSRLAARALPSDHDLDNFHTPLPPSMLY